MTTYEHVKHIQTLALQLHVGPDWREMNNHTASIRGACMDFMVYLNRQYIDFLPTRPRTVDDI